MNILAVQALSRVIVVTLSRSSTSNIWKRVIKTHDSIQYLFGFFFLPVIMPPSALDRLASMHVDYPMLFELNNATAGRVTHCGVLEFVADEGLIYVPYWMMENMLLQEGDIVQVKNKSLVKGTYVKLQPHTKDFLDISNPKAILETTLRSYSCLTTGDTIMVPYNNKKYYINIVEAKPSSAISIIETDCEVDFAPPLDYVEPEKPTPSTSSTLPKKRPQEAEEEPVQKVARFNPFTGSARRLDGKPSTESVAPVSSPILKQHQLEGENGAKDSKPSTSASRQRSGKLVFGSNSNQPTKEAPKAAPKKQESSEKAEEEKETKFQAFTGKKYSLKG
ncbi:ubiquitin recognition factor in ER-associated degradation protein 1 isoform X1 [Rosa chinensis]|uniref:ubiquitin recognition factor in ER-associated degradation protein 1 isoform X1 n=1 Tax=Rosa chinensis TaxID=74649 RepID=UPI000D08CD65|nr:ubiquitin recognition factor in ER-associated degradation protein 1 isoform X1 [Rosa chinensis]XP_024157471.1 ubiquitin recognition factor in ER-associated degradation protein 1 isoform X1 [Rosa chinensis]